MHLDIRGRHAAARCEIVDVAPRPDAESIADPHPLVGRRASVGRRDGRMLDESEQLPHVCGRRDALRAELPKETMTSRRRPAGYL